MASLMVAVVIPIYKHNPDPNEIVSLNQCLNILKKHPVIFIAPEKLIVTNYQQICSSQVQFRVERFEDTYFSDIEGYNNLMLSVKFYDRFKKYKYILIYQLDAYVFKDELLYWCRQNFDFIGAPQIPHQNLKNELQFLKGYRKFINFINNLLGTKHQISNVGNGGLSLRKTRSIRLLLKVLKPQVIKWGRNNEDGFFKYWGNLLYPFFNLPTDQTALNFSIENAPAASLKELGKKLPFGCHAFEKFEPETWKLYIPELSDLHAKNNK